MNLNEELVRQAFEVVEKENRNPSSTVKDQGIDMNEYTATSKIFHDRGSVPWLNMSLDVYWGLHSVFPFAICTPLFKETSPNNDNINDNGWSSSATAEVGFYLCPLFLW